MKAIHDPRYVEMIGLLRAARKTQGLRQDEVGERLGKAQSYISKVETGERRIDLIEVLALCEALQVPLEAVVPYQLRHVLTENSHS